MRNLYVYGFYNIGNAGNEAMLRAFIDGVTAWSPEPVAITVATRHPSPAFDAAYGVRTVPNLEHETRAASEGRWLRGLNPGDGDQAMSVLRELAASDLAVIGPGQYLVETGTSGMLRGALGQFLTVAAGCRLVGTPLMGLALACEDLRSAWARLAVQHALPGLADLTFRDERSVANLCAATLTLPRHAVLGDLALAGARAPAEAGVQVLAGEGIPPATGPRLAVAPRRIYWLGLDEQETRIRIAATIERWLEAPDRDVVFVPQNVYAHDGGRDDDRAEASRIRDLLPQHLAGRAHVIRGVHDPSGIEAVYGLCTVTLSARLHGAVFSCKQGTPPIMLSFMDKARGFFERLGHPELLAALDSDPADLASRLSSLIDSRAQTGLAIAAAAARIGKTATEYARRCATLLARPASDQQVWARDVLRHGATSTTERNRP